MNIIHWRGDRESVEDQVIKALTSPITSGQPDLKAVEDRVGSIPGYAPLFKAAFADAANPITAADELQVKELDRGPTGFFVFDPELVRVKPGETVDFIASDKGHDVHSVNGMIPNGAQPIDGKTNQDTKVMFSQPGVYVITCKVHTLMGMMCVVLVGDPVNIDKIDPSALPPKAKAKIQTLLNQIKKEK